MAAYDWVLTDPDAKNIYTKMCNWYNAPNQLPNHVKTTGVFFGYDNFTRDKLWYCIEYLKKHYTRGWFTDNFTDRTAALNHLADELYEAFLKTVDWNGIKKFLVWVYTFAKQDEDAVKYFTGGNYGIIDNIVNSLTQKVVEPTKEAGETVAYGLSVPSLKSILPDNSSMVKLCIFGALGIIAYKFFK